MKVTIDATVLLTRKFGIGSATASLIEALEARSDVDVRRLYRFVRGRTTPPNSLRRRVPYALSDFLFDRIHLPGDRFCGNADIFHATTGFCPRFRSTKTIATIYDLAFKVNPEWFSADLDQKTRKLLDRSDHIITISENTRRDLIRFYGYPAERVTSVLLGAPPISDRARGSKHLLYVGTIEPRKNIVRLIRAYRSLGTHTPLVLVGARGWKCEEVFREIEAAPNVIWRDYVSDAELGELYRDAIVFLYPSLYEGFGLPVLEAMAHGCPVITSTVSSLPEVGGDAAVYVDPESVDDIAAKMDRLLGDEGLRDQLSAAGRKRAAEFTWERTAAETVNVYCGIIAT